MKVYTFEGKNIEEAKAKALSELNTTEDNIIIKVLSEKQGLLKKITKIAVYNINDVIEYLKDSIKEITELMNINANLEIKRREKSINITIFSDKTGISYQAPTTNWNYKKRKLCGLPFQKLYSFCKYKPIRFSILRVV